MFFLIRQFGHSTTWLINYFTVLIFKIICLMSFGSSTIRTFEKIDRPMISSSALLNICIFDNHFFRSWKNVSSIGHSIIWSFRHLVIWLTDHLIIRPFGSFNDVIFWLFDRATFRRFCYSIVWSSAQFSKNVKFLKEERLIGTINNWRLWFKYSMICCFDHWFFGSFIHSITQ